MRKHSRSASRFLWATFALLSVLVVLSGGLASASHSDSTEFITCDATDHHNNYDIRWHFSTADGEVFSSEAKSTIRNNAVPNWNYRDTSNFHHHFDTGDPWHIIKTKLFTDDDILAALTLPGSTTIVVACGTPTYPVSNNHFGATEIRVNYKHHAWWESIDPPQQAKFDLYSVVTHEWGHMMGLAHSCEASYPDSVMRGEHLSGECSGFQIGSGEMRRVLDHYDKTLAVELYACHAPPIAGCLP